MRRRTATLALVAVVAAAVAAFAWLARRPEPPSAAPRPWRLSNALFDVKSGFPLAGASPPAAPERIWIGPGETLHAAPGRQTRAVSRFDHHASLKVVDRRPGWVKVEHGRHSGWVPLSGEWQEPPLGSAPDPTLPRPAQTPDPARLALARATLGDDATTGRLGPYALHTDLADPERLAWLDRVAAGFDDAYRRRYGLAPVGEPAESVVLFAGEAAYRRFVAGDDQIGHLPASGHAAYGLVALFDGGRSAAEVGATLAHELAHLLNRRAIGPALPSWLDEGIADELAQSRIGPSGRLEAGAVGGATVRSGERLQMHGAHASLFQLVEAVHGGRLRPLPELLDLGWRDFVTPPRGRLHYAQSAFFVRYLLDGEDGALAPGFRRYLAGIAAGGSAEPAALRGHLGRSWEDLDVGYRAWLVARQAEAAATVAAASE